jgi:uncharacterized Ntn-hydrolase superfamily protein
MFACLQGLFLINSFSSALLKEHVMKLKLALVLLLAATLHAQSRPVHTFSIVARDPRTGELGVAVQSHWFSVGSIVTWAEPGIGAVATQSFVDPSYGPLGLSLIRAGKGAPETLKGLLEADPGAEVRQVAMIDTQGHVAVWTGGKDIQAAGHVAAAGKNPQPGISSWTSHEGGRGDVGENFSCQANLMSNDKVWPAMAKAYQETKGELAERLLAALDAAQAVGGDIRGKQSAALVIVSGKRTDHPWERIFDVRVDDAPEPLKELRRLVTLQRAYNHMNAGDTAVEHHDNETALREYSTAEQIASSTPGVLPSRLAEMMYWHAVALVNMGRVDDSLPVFKKAFAIEPGWRTLTPRLPKSGLLPGDPSILGRITAQ